jgi:ribosomal protein S18 acetylase RimI-like enzyme
MTLSVSNNSNIVIRPLQYRDLEAIKGLLAEESQGEAVRYSVAPERQLKKPVSWYGLGKFLRFLPHPYQLSGRIYVAQQQQQILGLIQVSAFNSARSTWRVEKVLLNTSAIQTESLTSRKEIGSQLLRYCLENIWEARTWILEVNVNEKDNLALYRENGFQPLAQMTYWAIAPELLAELAEQEPDLPNLLPISNADAQLLYQLDCVSMPPLLRQVFDRHIQDFKTNLWETALTKFKNWLEKAEVAKGYVFEPQRKAAIGYFQLDLHRDGSHPYRAKLTVHPAYTWLYPQLIAQMAQIWQKLPPQPLELVSADYQPEREEYLDKLGAERVEHTLLMSRSVWHKLKETKPLEGLQLPEVFQGLKPVRTPIPSRISWFKSIPQAYHHPIQQQDLIKNQSDSSSASEENKSTDSSKPPSNGHHA